MNIAEHVISTVGGGDFTVGLHRVCAWCNRRRTVVYRWTYPVERGGTGGRIPTQFQGVILHNARSIGIGLEPDDFFDPADLIPVNDNQTPVPAGDTVNNMEFGPEVPSAPRVMLP